MLRVEKGIMLHKEAYLSPLAKIDDLQSFLSEYIKAYYRQDSATIPRRVLIGMEIEDRQAMEQMLAERRGGRVWLSVPSKTLDRQIMKMAEANAVEELVMYEGRTKAPATSAFRACMNVLGRASWIWLKFTIYLIPQRLMSSAAWLCLAAGLYEVQI